MPLKVTSPTIVAIWAATIPPATQCSARRTVNLWRGAQVMCTEYRALVHWRRGGRRQGPELVCGDIGGRHSAYRRSARRANQLPRNCANCTTMMIVTTATAVTAQL
uniref:Uncharacterized protein n=1 Tax=Mus musculus TaxID=10090 RepID=Q3TZZ4_MOUSE|nr:unnamed protein product [Mus musculus]